MKCPVADCPLGLVRIEGIHLSPVCPAHGSPEADNAERRVGEAEFHVGQLRGALDRAERRAERVEVLADKLAATPDWYMSYRHVAQSIRTALAQGDGESA